MIILNAMLSLVLVCLVNGSVTPKPAKTGKPSWGYWKSIKGVHGPAEWPSISSQCGGSMQSPIDISPQYIPSKVFTKPLQVESDNNLGLVAGVFANTGYTAQFTMNEKAGSVYISGGPLDVETYKLSSIQFHYGCTDNVGSEHTFDTVPSAAEMHMVFYNSKYKNVKNAVNMTDGMTIVAVLFDYYGGVEYYANPTLDKMVGVLKNITSVGSYLTFDHDDQIELTKLVPGLTQPYPYYFTYKGSITTPPCYESVNWIILNSHLTISVTQLEQFRLLQTPHGTQQCDNYRPTQPANSREILKNF